MIRSIKELRHYDIAARDGSLGDVHDLFFDDHSWQVRYLVVDTGNWLPGRRVLVSPEAVEGIDGADGTLPVDTDLKTIEHAPKYEPGMEIDAALERRIFQHYGRAAAH
jgi:hypothetical protein